MTAPLIDHTTGEILDDTIELARQQLGVAITELHHEALLADDPKDLARALAVTRDAKADLAVVFRDIEDRLTGHWPDEADAVVVDGLGVFGLHRRTKRTGWDHDSLIADIVATVDTTDNPDPTSAVVAALRACISFGAGKVTGLRARGLQPDEYCQETDGGLTVEMPPRDHGQDVA